MALFKSASETTLKVTGMHCQKCVARVKDALENVDGVMSAEVSLEEEKAVVTGSVYTASLVEAVVALDFGCEVA